jgi:AP-4 complex subunit mu-1
MSISQFFVLSLRGDTIIYRDFRRDIKKNINETFFRKVNFWDSEDEAPPIFNVEGVNFIYSKKSDLYLVLTTKDNVSPSYFLEILERLMKVIRDHCGVLSEESIRKNFVLIYEIIDEMIDFGFPQLASTEQIKPFVYTEPIVIANSNTSFNASIFNKNSKSSDAIKKPISQATDGKKQKNEIFVDIFEKITILFNSTGNIINSSVDGCIKMKSYLKGNPELKLVLSDDICIGRPASYTSAGNYIEDYNFHQNVNRAEFESAKTIYVSPPEGEFTAMNYRINTEFSPPFRIYSYIEQSDYKLELKLKVQANFSDKFFAGNVLIKFNVPKHTQNVYFETTKNKIGQKTDFLQNENCCYWKITKFQGGADYNLVVKITLTHNKVSESRKELGPVTLNFEIPTYNISKLQVKELKILTNEKNYNASRWVRCITQANSYVARIA